MGSRIFSEASTASSKEALREKPAKASSSYRRRRRNQTIISLIKREVSSNLKVESLESIDLGWTEKIPECPVFHPSEEEFEEPLTYLQKIAPEASKYGICKIISPLKASIPAVDVLMKEKKDFVFDTYMQPLRLAKRDVIDKITFFKGERKHNYNTFKSMADEEFAHQFPHSKCLPPEYLEKKFWQELSQGRGRIVEYAANVEGSAFSCHPNDRLGKSRWNLQNLSKLPESTFRLLEYQIPGITEPMLYIGMLFSQFAWHVEDHFLYSINYHHYGAPKTWYGVPGHAACQLEKAVVDHVYSRRVLSTDGEDGAFDILAGKTTMFSPNILLEYDVPVYKAMQMPGEFIITFPRAYHSGFSHGFNCGEAVNFAISDWFPWGADAGQLYSRLKKMVILPYEELLCREAILLFESSKHECSYIKACFVRHIRSINSALSHLNDSRAEFSYFSSSQGTIICNICQRDSYLAFIECNSCYHHTCLFHEAKPLDCSCLGKRIVYLREDFCDVEDAYRKFESEEVLPEDEEGTCMGSQLNIMSCVEEGLARFRYNKLEAEERSSAGSTRPNKEGTATGMRLKDNPELATNRTCRRQCHDMTGFSSSRDSERIYTRSRARKMDNIQ